MRVTQPTAVGLIATHAALTSGVHGATGVIATLTDVEILTNKTIGAGGLTFENEGAGTDPVLTSDSGVQDLLLTGRFQATADIHFKSGTAFLGKFEHAISANRIYTFPDVAGTILIAEDTAQTPTFTSITVLNAGAGTNPVLTSSHASQYLNLAGSLHITSGLETVADMWWKSNTGFWGFLEHANSANRAYTFPDVAGTVCMWNAANAAVTRYWGINFNEALRYQDPSAGAFWIVDGANSWLEATSTTESIIIDLHLPHGATITAIRVLAQESDVNNIETRLFRSNAATPGVEILAEVNSTATMEEVADTSVANGVVDNDTYSYYVQIHLDAYTSGEGRFRRLQVDYTVTTPHN